MPDRQIRLLAHNIRSLWNVGSFFRTCDALGIEKLYLTGYTGYPPRKEISKTAIGAEEWVAWETQPDPLPILKNLKSDGWTLAALEITDKAIDIETYDAPQKVCLIVGHELEGVPASTLELCDVTLKIPMRGNKESLNVAVAAGIGLYCLRTHKN